MKHTSAEYEQMAIDALEEARRNSRTIYYENMAVVYAQLAVAAATLEAASAVARELARLPVGSQ